MNISYEMLGKDKVVISLEDFEDMLDVISYDEAKARNEEAFPADMVDRMLGGENPVRVFREHRGLTQTQLAAHAGVSQATVAEIETGRKKGSVGTLKAIAGALQVDLDDLV